MGKGPSAPEQPVITPTPSPVKETSEDVRQAGIDEKDRLKRRKGYESTLLNPVGELSGTPVSTKKATLG